MAASRHTEPTPTQLLRRIYRHQVASEKALRALELTVANQAATIRGLADHCTRLLREKDTLLRVVGQRSIEPMSRAALLAALKRFQETPVTMNGGDHA